MFVALLGCRLVDFCFFVICVDDKSECAGYSSCERLCSSTSYWHCGAVHMRVGSAIMDNFVSIHFELPLVAMGFNCCDSWQTDPYIRRYLHLHGSPHRSTYQIIFVSRPSLQCTYVCLIIPLQFMCLITSSQFMYI